jgi:hypothetical protein
MEKAQVEVVSNSKLIWTRVACWKGWNRDLQHLYCQIQVVTKAAACSAGENCFARASATAGSALYSAISALRRLLLEGCDFENGCTTASSIHVFLTHQKLFFSLLPLLSLPLNREVELDKTTIQNVYKTYSKRLHNVRKAGGEVTQH